MSTSAVSPTNGPGGEASIRLRIHHVNQLFHSLDPFPFRERDLDTEVEDYVVGWARELGPRARLAIIIHMPAAQARAEGAAQIAEGFRNYFTARADALALERRALFRRGRSALAIGLPILAATVLLGSVVTHGIPAGFARRFIEEGLIIVGWVANWKPFEILLFEWLPISQKRDLYRRLAGARVEVLEDPAPSGTTP
jgi:hypothetical protein